MKRQAFGMIFAIIVTVLVATLGILGLKLSSSTLNTTTNEYIAIQLDLYLNSTVELAILYIQRNSFKYQEGSTTLRPNEMMPITKYINYGQNDEYKFTYKMTPLINDSTKINGSNLSSSPEQLGTMVNTMVLDVSGFVVNPITNQTFRVTKRQVIKP